MRHLIRLSATLCGWLLLAGSSVGAPQPMESAFTYELSLAANRPPCEKTDDPSARCRGTKGERAVFNVRTGNMLWFEQAQPAPVAFVFVGPLAVEPFAYPSPALGIGVQQSEHGLIVEAVYGLQRTTQAIGLDQWVQIHLPPHTNFWMQLKRAR